MVGKISKISFFWLNLLKSCNRKLNAQHDTATWAKNPHHRNSFHSYEFKESGWSKIALKSELLIFNLIFRISEIDDTIDWKNTRLIISAVLRRFYDAFLKLIVLTFFFTLMSQNDLTKLLDRGLKITHQK